MELTLFKTNNPALKLISILFILVLTISKISAQTTASTSGNKPAFIPTMHYQQIPTIHSQQKTKAVVASQIKIYSIVASKNFPIIECGERYVLNAKDDSENFNYDELFCDRAITPAKDKPENTWLAKL